MLRAAVARYGRKFVAAIMGLGLSFVLAVFGLLMLKWAPEAGGAGSIRDIIGSFSLLVGAIMGAFSASNAYVEGKHASKPTQTSTATVTTTTSGPAPVVPDPASVTLEQRGDT